MRLRHPGDAGGDQAALPIACNQAGGLKMITKTIGAAGALAMALQGFAAATAAFVGLAAAPAHAASFWGCDSGFAFQTNGSGTAANGGRCFKASQTEFAPPLACPRINTPAGAVGAALRIDNNGVNDVCATQIGIVFTAEVACGFGYTMERRTGADRCKKTIPAEERQPSRKFVP
jgi:hypothetical protein